MYIVKPKYTSKIVCKPEFPYPDTQMTPKHTILVVTSENEEKWVIDTVGCQFGFGDILVPMARYLNKKTRGNPLQTDLYDKHHEVWDLEGLYFDPSDFEGYQEIDLERPARLHFAKFIKEKIQDEGDSFSKNMLPAQIRNLKSRSCAFVKKLARS